MACDPESEFWRIIAANYTPPQRRALARIARLVEQGLAVWKGK